MLLKFRKIGDGKPLIILHGVFGSGDNWLTVSKLFSDKYSIYLVDQRNHGLSPWSNVFNYDVLAEDVKELIQHETLQHVVLMGHSMGGKVAMRFAQLYPEYLDKLIVVDISPAAYKPHHQSIISGLMAVKLENLKSRLEADTLMSAYITEPDVRQFLLKNLYRDAEGRFHWRLNLEGIANNILAIGEALPDGTNIETKTLFIAGAHSKYIQAEDEALIRQRFPSVQIVTIPKAGHWVHAEQPQALADVVNEFLNR